ncbi:hypothetical protein VTO73DRAFT_9925 [Trametes versicolor]
MPSRRAAPTSRPTTPTDTSISLTTTTAGSLAGGAPAGGPLHSTPPPRSYALVASSPPTSPRMVNMQVHAPGPPRGANAAGRTLMGPGVTPEGAAGPGTQTGMRLANHSGDGGLSRTPSAASEAPGLPNAEAKSSEGAKDGPKDKGKGRGPPGPPSPRMSPVATSTPSSPPSPPLPAFPEGFEVHGTRYVCAEDLSCGIAEGIMSGAQYDDYITDGIGRDGQPLPGQVPDYEQRKRKRARIHTPSPECEEAVVFYGRALPGEIPNPPTPYPATITTARALIAKDREEYGRLPPPSPSRTSLVPPPSTQPRQPISRLGYGMARPARTRKSLPLSQPSPQAGRTPHVPMNVDPPPPFLPQVPSFSATPTPRARSGTGMQLCPTILARTTAGPPQRSATVAAAARSGTASQQASSSRTLWTGGWDDRSWSAPSTSTRNDTPRPPPLVDPFCPSNMSHRPPNYREPMSFEMPRDVSFNLPAVTEEAPPEAGLVPSQIHPEHGSGQLPSTSSAPPATTARRTHTYIAQMATLQAYSPQGFVFTAAPDGGFGPHDFPDPEHLIHGMASGRVADIWRENGRTTLFVENYGIRHPSPRLIRTLTDGVTAAFSAMTRTTGFRVIEPVAAHPAHRWSSPSTFTLTGVPEHVVDAVVNQRVWLSTFLTLLAYRRAITLPNFLCRLVDLTQDPELDVARMVWEAFNGPSILPTLLRFARGNSRFNGMGTEEAANIILSSLRVHVTTLDDNSLVAAVYCDSPAATVSDWREWRDTVRRASFRFGDQIATVAQLALCAGCHSAAHSTELCPLPLLPGWNAPPPRPRPRPQPARDTTDLGPSSLTAQGDVAGPSTFNRSMRGRGSSNSNRGGGGGGRQGNGRRGVGNGNGSGGGNGGGNGGGKGNGGKRGRNGYDGNHYDREPYM